MGKRALVMDVPEKNWKGRRKWMRDLLHVRRKTLPYHDHCMADVGRDGRFA